MAVSAEGLPMWTSLDVLWIQDFDAVPNCWPDLLQADIVSVLPRDNSDCCKGTDGYHGGNVQAN